MTFEEFIKKLSAFVASLIVYAIAASTYLGAKGFIMNNGEVYLAKSASAKAELKPIETAPEVNIILPKNHVLGKDKAPVTIYEYSSLGCSHCKDFHLDVLPKIKKEYIDTGKVKLIFADFPLDKKSLQGSLVARCLPKDKYYDFLSLMFEKQREWGLSRNTEKVLAEYASLNGITKEKALECMKDEKNVQELVDIRQQALHNLKIDGTPSFLIVTKKDKEILHGAPSYNTLKEILDKKINAK